jgi:hypothetical protein
VIIKGINTFNAICISVFLKGLISCCKLEFSSFLSILLIIVKPVNSNITNKTRTIASIIKIIRNVSTPNNTAKTNVNADRRKTTRITPKERLINLLL